MKMLINRLLRKVGIIPLEAESGEIFPPDFEASDIRIIKAVRPYTMTSSERIVALIRAIQHIVKNDIPGDIVECGVWRGGSMMAALMAMMDLGVHDRGVHLFDTFEGMTGPTESDLSYRGEPADKLMRSSDRMKERNVWAYSPLDRVKENVLSLGYDERRIHFVKGPVEETIPGCAPERISLLRLDTDWYESTRHELVHLYPRLSSGGILIIDDYGHWQGARKASDEYIAENKLTIFLNRIDYTGRIALKP